MTSKGLGEMFEGDFADTCAGKFPLVLIRGRAEGLTCADPGARTPIGTSGIQNSAHGINFIFVQSALSFQTLHLVTAWIFSRTAENGEKQS